MLSFTPCPYFFPRLLLPPSVPTEMAAGDFSGEKERRDRQTVDPYGTAKDTEGEGVKEEDRDGVDRESMCGGG